MKLKMPTLSTLWRWMERHAAWFAILTAALSVFILCDPCGRRAWDTFFTNNDKVLEIYWQTLTILLVILIPVTGAVIDKLDKKFPDFGARIFFQQVVRVKQFWILVPFSFLLFFARVPVPAKDVLSGNVIIDPETLTRIHYLLFVIWCFLFWGFFEILRKSVALFVDLGDLQNEIFYRHLLEYGRQQNAMGDDENEGLAWKLLWNDIDAKNEKWHRKFLLLFWKRQGELIQGKQYFLVTSLLESFAQQYLTFGDSQKQSDIVRQRTVRKRWLWFHEKQMNDGAKNPHAIVTRLLDIHFATWRNFENIRKSGSIDDGTWLGLSNLQGFLRIRLETLFHDELGKPDDYYHSFFRCLTGFFDTVAQDKPTLSAEEYRKYLESLPVYRPVFEAAHAFDLSNYEPRAEVSSFPDQWRVPEACLSQGGIGNDVQQRRIWYEQFLRWSQDRIDHGKPEWDSALDGAIKMLFPEAYAPWMAFAFAYRALAFGKSRIAGLCSWHQNFGQSQATWTDISDIAQGENRQALIARRMEEEEKKQKDVAARIIQKLGFFGTPEEIRALIGVLENCEGSFKKEIEREGNRREILEMLQTIQKLFPSEAPAK